MLLGVYEKNRMHARGGRLRLFPSTGLLYFGIPRCLRSSFRACAATLTGPANHQAVRIELAKLTLIGDREENQDRVATIERGGTCLLIVVDGMGGHADGARAAELAVATVTQAFESVETPVFDPQGFLHHTVAEAHTQLVALGAQRPFETRPRATCALCLIQDDGAYWAHVGDSRIYHVRAGRVIERSRDHSHVELLLQEGLISEDDLAEHPMRNFVECCLGGEAVLPRMTVTRGKRLLSGDVLLVCTDGLWSGLSDDQLATLGGNRLPLARALKRLGEMAVRACAPYSDNTSATVARLLP